MRSSSPLLALLVTTYATAAFAAVPKPNLLRELREMFDDAPAKQKEKLPCRGEWKTVSGRTPIGEPYTSLQCAYPEAEFSEKDGAVLMLAVQLNTGGFDQMREYMKERIAELKAAKCVQVLAQGQMEIFDCPGGDAVGVVHSWDWKTDRRSIKAFFGRSERLLPTLAVSVPKHKPTRKPKPSAKAK